MRDLWERAERAFSLCFDGLSIGIRIAIGYRTGFLCTGPRRVTWHVGWNDL